jgi:hypothetical protein
MLMIRDLGSILIVALSIRNLNRRRPAFTDRRGARVFVLQIMNTYILSGDAS